MEQQFGQEVTVLANLEHCNIGMKMQNRSVTLRLAIDCIHGLGFIHKDLKSDNLLLLADKSIRIAHFGVDRIERFGAAKRRLLETSKGPTAPHAAGEAEEPPLLLLLLLLLFLLAYVLLAISDH